MTDISNLIDNVGNSFATAVKDGFSRHRGGSVCLNSSGCLAKWISASIMLPPSSVAAR